MKIDGESLIDFFHYTLYRDCHRPYYLQIVNTSLNRIERYQRMQLTMTQGVERACREHTAILQACSNHNTGLAMELTRQHIMGVSRSLIDILTQNRSRPSDYARP